MWRRLQITDRSQPVSPSDAAAAASSAMPEFPAIAMYIQKRLILQHINMSHDGILPPNLLLGPNVSLKKYQPDSAYAKRLQREVEAYEDEHQPDLPPFTFESSEGREAIRQLIDCSIVDCEARLPEQVQQLLTVRRAPPAQLLKIIDFDIFYKLREPVVA